MQKPRDPDTIKRDDSGKIVEYTNWGDELNELPKNIVKEIQKDEFERDNPTSPIDEAPIR